MTAARSPVRPVAVVSGASSGIGAALARLLASQGYDVALLARRRNALDQVAATVIAAGGQAHVEVVDLTDAAAVAQAIANVCGWRPQLDVVVANAGVYQRGLATMMRREHLETALRDNFWTAYHLVEAMLPVLRAQRRGQLVFVNSFDAKKGMPMDAAYATAKAALASYAASLRQALRSEGVGVCSVFPGRVDTPMVDGVEVPAISAKIPPERVARAVLMALRRRQAEVIVPWHIRPLWWLEVVSPRLADWLVRRLRLDGWSSGPAAEP
ncbi:MAG: SDR family NAD(P)-dependent oxidoreductase [Planctomycetes bacterium]|nr:SDR family NAD(P)-dependent oxidoreductase [Planctomycetota bacterium]